MFKKKDSKGTKEEIKRWSKTRHDVEANKRLLKHLEKNSSGKRKNTPPSIDHLFKKRN